MHFKPYFSEWAKGVDQYLISYLKNSAVDVKKSAPIASDLITDFSDFIMGGKRLRAGLVKLGYEMFRGKDGKAILPVAAAVEVVHGALLVHDDIIDRGETRHNKPTIHLKYSQEYKGKAKDKADALHYGESMALMVGDIALYEGIGLCLNSSFPAEVKEQLVKKLIKVILDTAYGEILDVELAYKPNITEKEVMTVFRLKTALYTFVGPLTYGILAAPGYPRDKTSRQKVDKAILMFGLPVGIAYQLTDDILGVFGDEQTLGKSADSDIKEGKNTILYLETIKRATKLQRQFLQKIWGDPTITNKEVEEVRKIIKQTGSFDYSLKLAAQLISQAKRAIPRLTRNKAHQEILATLADYMVEREK